MTSTAMHHRLVRVVAERSVRKVKRNKRNTRCDHGVRRKYDTAYDVQLSVYSEMHVRLYEYRYDTVRYSHD